MNPCSQAAREAKEGAAKAADEAESKGDVFRDTPSLLGARQAISHAKKPARKPVSVAPYETSHSTHIRTGSRSHNGRLVGALPRTLMPMIMALTGAEAEDRVRAAGGGRSIMPRVASRLEQRGHNGQSIFAPIGKPREDCGGLPRQSKLARGRVGNVTWAMAVNSGNDVISRSIIRKQFWEPDDTAHLLNELAQTQVLRGHNPTLLDIGANIGWFALVAAMSGRASQVIAVEVCSVCSTT